MATKEELLRQIAEIEASDKTETETRRKLANEARNKVACSHENYEWRVSPDSYNRRDNALQVERCIKSDVWLNLVSMFPNEISEHDNRWDGMCYCRTDENILTNTGGGRHILNTPKLCNDEEWAQIAAGNVPAKFALLPNIKGWYI